MFGSRQIAGKCARALSHIIAFVIAKNKKPVFDNWCAQSKTELILPQNRARQTVCLIYRVVGIERVVAKKFIDGAANIVGAAFGYETDNRAGIPPVFRAEITGLNLKFAHRFNRRRKGNHTLFGNIDVHAVEKKSVGTRRRTVDIKRAAVAVIGRCQTELIKRR